MVLSKEDSMSFPMVRDESHVLKLVFSAKFSQLTSNSIVSMPQRLQELHSTFSMKAWHPLQELKLESHPTIPISISSSRPFEINCSVKFATVSKDGWILSEVSSYTNEGMAQISFVSSHRIQSIVLQLSRSV